MSTLSNTKKIQKSAIIFGMSSSRHLRKVLFVKRVKSVK